MSEVDEFLDVIGFLESSGGKNFAHRKMQSGIHKGTSAAGTYGIMPNTALEIVNRAEAQNKATPEMKKLRKMTARDIKKTIEENPELERSLAKILAGHVLKKSGGDPEKAAYRWFMGHNLSEEALNKRNYQDTDYVRKFKKEREKQMDRDRRRRRSTREELFGDQPRNEAMRSIRDSFNRPAPQKLEDAWQNIKKNMGLGRDASTMEPDMSQQVASLDPDMLNRPMDIDREPTQLPPNTLEASQLPPMSNPLGLAEEANRRYEDVVNPQDELVPATSPRFEDLRERLRRNR